MKRIEAEDLYEFRFLSGLKTAPGTDMAAWLVKQADTQKNGYSTQIRIRQRGGEERLLLKDVDVKAFCWEDDAHLLYLMPSASGQTSSDGLGPVTSVVRLDVVSGASETLFDLNLAAQDLAAVTGGTLAVIGRIRTGDPDAYLLRAGEASSAQDDPDVEVLDEIPFRFNGMGYTNKRRAALFIVSLADGGCRRVSAPEEEVSAYSVADGKVWYAAEAFTAKRLYRQKIYCWDVAEQETRLVMGDASYEISYLTAYRGGVLFAGSTWERYGYNENHMFYYVDAQTQVPRLFYANPDSLHPAIGSDVRLGVTRLVKTVGDAVYYLATRRDSVCLMKLSADGTASPVIGETGTVDDFDIYPVSGGIVAAGMYEGLPEEIFDFEPDGSGRRRVSDYNTSFLSDRYVAVPERIVFHCREYDLDGWILKPIDYDPSRTYPGVLDIHGGPKMAFGPVFYHEMQVWAGRGYFVFYCNPIGSDGRGNEFLYMRGKYGTVDYDSLMAFVDTVLERYPQIDDKRLAVTGGSYGGYMTNWIITHTDRFACAASQRSISNWIGFYGYSDLGYNFNVDQLAASPFTDPWMMWDRSPLKYADRVTTPTLFIHSDEDYRCPLSDGMQMLTALVDHGVPTKMCVFKGENHELSRSGRPRARLRRLREITQWFEQYVGCRNVD